jgi:hypothetical protein
MASKMRIFFSLFPLLNAAYCKYGLTDCKEGNGRYYTAVTHFQEIGELYSQLATKSKW